MNVHVTVSLDPAKLAEFDAWWKGEGFKSRSEALTYLMTSVRPQPKPEVQADETW
jgi:metal-responsive CopG/Arc/MetJ family transcriptional regulator